MDLELFFIIQKMLYNISTGKFLGGLDSIIFHTKPFEQKHVLTAFINVTLET